MRDRGYVRTDLGDSLRAYDAGIARRFLETSP
jgi:hypothetical protein